MRRAAESAVRAVRRRAAAAGVSHGRPAVGGGARWEYTITNVGKPALELPEHAVADFEMQKEYWDDFAEIYDDSYYGYWSMKVHEHYVQQVKARPGMKILDVGCGTGALAVELAKEGAEVTALDWSEGMIEVTAERVTEVEKAAGDLPHTPLKIDLLEQPIETVALPADHFDVVLCHDVLQYLEDPLPALANMYKALTPYGTLYASTLGEIDENPCLAAVYKVLQESVAPEARYFFSHSTLEYDTQHSRGPRSTNPAFRLAKQQRLLDGLNDAGFAHTQVARQQFTTTFSDVALYNLADDSYRFGGEQYGRTASGNKALRDPLAYALFEMKLMQLTETRHRIRQRRRPVFCTFNVATGTKLRDA